jgi:quercetin dioxygenase-like cupin family protein
MLGQIELGRSTPTIRVLWRIANAFEVPVSAFLDNDESEAAVLLPRAQARILESHEGLVTSRALFPFEGKRNVEFYEMHFATGVVEHSDPHTPGTIENVVVADGQLEIGVGSAVYTLQTGDALQFEADAAHTYRNRGNTTAVIYMVMSYPETAEYR